MERERGGRQRSHFIACLADPLWPSLCWQLICLWPGKQPYGWCGFTKGCTQPVTVHPHISLVDNWCVKGTLPFNPTLEELLAKYGHLKDKVIR